MADTGENEDSLLNPRYATTTLTLRPLSWRIFHRPASPEELDCTTIEIQCELRLGWDDKIEVAGFSIADLPLSIQLSRASQEWLDDAIERQGVEFDGKGLSRKRMVIGALDYSPFTKEWLGKQPKNGSIHGWIAYGPATFDRILTTFMAGVQHIALSVEARFDERAGSSMFPAYVWSGKKPLDIVGGNVVVLSEDPDAQAPILEPSAPEPIDERREAIARHAEIIATIQKLMVPLWAIAAIVMIGSLLAH